MSIRHSFTRWLFTCVPFAFNLSWRGTILDAKMLLLSHLKDNATCIIFLQTSTTLMPCIKSFLPECDKMFSWLLDVSRCYYNFIIIEEAPIKVLVAIVLLFITSLAIKSSTVTVTRHFFLCSFVLTCPCWLFFLAKFSFLGLLQLLLAYGVLSDTSRLWSYSLSF